MSFLSLLFPPVNSSYFAITNACSLLHIISTLLAALSIGSETKLLCNSFKLAITLQFLSAELEFLGIILVLLILSSMAEVTLFLHLRKLPMLVALFPESIPIYSLRLITICILASCQVYY